MAYALVTGASTGIGHDLAKLCACAGYDVIAVARNRAQLESLASEIGNTHRRQVRIAVKDLSRPEAAAELYEELAGLRSDVVMLINNAGVGMLGFFAELDTEKQMEMLRLNVDALTHLTRLFVPAMIARRKGYVLNVASTAAFQPGPLMAVYYASKAYVVSFSSALHNELKPHGVVVTTLCPGPTQTEFQRRAQMEATRLFRGTAMNSTTVARIGFEAMMRGKPLVVAGRLNGLMAFLTRFAPRQMAASMARRMQEV
jgi:short-subunit dehydrogenase